MKKLEKDMVETDRKLDTSRGTYVFRAPARLASPLTLFVCCADVQSQIEEAQSDFKLHQSDDSYARCEREIEVKTARLQENANRVTSRCGRLCTLTPMHSSSAD